MTGSHQSTILKCSEKNNCGLVRDGTKLSASYLHIQYCVQFARTHTLGTVGVCSKYFYCTVNTVGVLGTHCYCNGR
jgi:hypothetical protein